MGFCLGIRRALGRASTSRVQSLRSAWTRLLAISGFAALAEHRTTGLSAVVATVLLSWTPLLSLETVAEVPFELYQHHLIVTKGSIGPLNGLSLLIDTGTIPSMVDGRIARKLHVQAEPSMLVAFGQSVAIQSTILNGFRIGARQPGAVPAGVSDLSYLEGVRIDAIVGLDVLARTSFSIDYRKRVLRFSPDGREESVAPLELVWPFLTVQMTIAGQQVRLLVDTGSSDLVLFKSRMPAALVGCALERRQDRAICVRRWRACSGSICGRSASERVSGTSCQPGRSIGCRTDTRRASTACSVCWPSIASECSSTSSETSSGGAAESLLRRCEPLSRVQTSAPIGPRALMAGSLTRRSRQVASLVRDRNLTDCARRYPVRLRSPS